MTPPTTTVTVEPRYAYFADEWHRIATQARGLVAPALTGCGLRIHGGAPTRQTLTADMEPVCGCAGRARE